jgi:hypothetical protein
MKVSLTIEIADEDAAQLIEDIHMIRELLEELHGASLQELQVESESRSRGDHNPGD